MSHDPGATDGSDGIPPVAMLEGLLGTPRGRVGACKITGDHPTVQGLDFLPWSQDPRGDDKTRLWRKLANTPGGAPLSVIVREVFEDSSGDVSSKDYQLAYRFYTDREFAEIRSAKGLNWVYPRLESLYLTNSMRSAKTPDGEVVGGSSARETARARLSRLRQLSDPLPGELLRDLAARRSGVDGRHIVLSRRNSEVIDSAPASASEDRPEYLILPFATALSSAGRASERWETYAGGWERAARDYKRGVVMTLTTDPSRFGSLLEATESLYADLNRLRSWLAYSPENGPNRPGYRPASIASIEFTESGLPHLHVAFFGVSWLTKHSALSSYCSENLDRCSVVWLDRIWREGSPSSGTWRWERSPDAPAEGRTPREYLGESLEVRRRICDLSSDELKRAGEALIRHGLKGPEASELDLDPLRERDLERGRDLWKAALYFATEIEYYTLSPSLREDPEETLPHAPVWERQQIGVYEDIPGYVIDAAAVIPRVRPPPWETDRLRDAGLPSGSAGGGSA